MILGFYSFSCTENLLGISRYQFSQANLFSASVLFLVTPMTHLVSQYLCSSVLPLLVFMLFLTSIHSSALTLWTTYYTSDAVQSNWIGKSLLICVQHTAVVTVRTTTLPPIKASQCQLPQTALVTVRISYIWNCNGWGVIIASTSVKSQHCQ